MKGDDDGFKKFMTGLAQKAFKAKSPEEQKKIITAATEAIVETNEESVYESLDFSELIIPEDVISELDMKSEILRTLSAKLLVKAEELSTKK